MKKKTAIKAKARQTRTPAKRLAAKRNSTKEETSLDAIYKASLARTEAQEKPRE